MILIVYSVMRICQKRRNTEMARDLSICSVMTQSTKKFKDIEKEMRSPKKKKEKERGAFLSSLRAGGWVGCLLSTLRRVLDTCYCHLDVNSFYASVEEARLYPTLEGKPVAVRQRNLLVTTNYVARARGVPKMCSVDEGRRLVPDLVVIESDMARYRAAHRALFDLLREMGLAP